MSSNVSDHIQNQVSEFDIEIAILSKNSDATITLPPYMYRDTEQVLRATETNRRAFRGIGSAEVIDSHNELVDLEAIRKVMDIMIKEMGGTLLYNHQNLRMGTILGWGDCTVFDENLKKEHQAIYIDFEVFDNYQTHRDVIEMMDLPDDHPEKIGMLSIGGRKMKKVRECNSEKCYDRVTEIEGHEYSLVKKGSNQFAFILEKTVYKPFGDGNKMEIAKPQLQDQSKVTLKIPDETVDQNTDPSSLNKKEDKKEEYEEDMDKMEDEEEDEDMDKMDDEEKDDKEDDKLTKALESIVDAIEDLTCRMSKTEDLLKSDTTVKPVKEVKKTIIHEGNTYILKKSSEKKVSKLEKRIENLKKGEKFTPVQSSTIQQVTRTAIDPLQKRKDELAKMSISDRVDLALTPAKSRNRTRLEEHGIFLQN